MGRWSRFALDGGGKRQDIPTFGIFQCKSILTNPYHCTDKGQVPPIHADTKASLQTTLSHHLTELRLSLPEIMVRPRVVQTRRLTSYLQYRIPALPRLITQSCNYCHKQLRVQDGQPCQRTGWLPPPNDRPANGYSYLDGRSPEAAGMQQEDGRWVCWHTSCDPSP